MRVPNENWTAEQYMALASCLFPGVTLAKMIEVTNSNEGDVFRRLIRMGLAKQTTNAPIVPGSSGWNWLNKVRKGRFTVYNADGSILVDVYPIIKAYGWKELSPNTLINGLYRFDPYKCQIMKE